MSPAQLLRLVGGQIGRATIHGKHKVWTGGELSGIGTGHAVEPADPGRLRVSRRLVAGQVELRQTWVRSCPAALVLAQDQADRDR